MLFGVKVLIEFTETDKSTEITKAFSDKTTSLTIHNSRQMSENEFTALVNGLKTNTTLKKLKIISTELTYEQYTELGEALGQNKGLTSLLI